MEFGGDGWDLVSKRFNIYMWCVTCVAHTCVASIYMYHIVSWLKSIPASGWWGFSSHRIPNLGEVDLDFMTLEGHNESWVCQIADVNKPLGSISDRIDKNCRVVYDKDMATGDDLSYILNKGSGKVMKMHRDGNVWILDAVVARDMVMPEEGFSRPS